MSEYTTGKMEKRCGVAGRAAPYYDSCALLVFSELMEGGKRIFPEVSEEEEGICFLGKPGLRMTQSERF